MVLPKVLEFVGVTTEVPSLAGAGAWESTGLQYRVFCMNYTKSLILMMF